MESEKSNIAFENASSGRNRTIFGGLAILLILFFFLDLFLGSVTIRPGEIIGSLFSNSDETIRTILTQFRLPKAITAISVGIALSISGLQMQTLFRNPMAGPYVLGVSSGASLGVAFVILGFSADLSPESIRGLGNWAIAAASWIGAGLVMLLIMMISSRVKNIMTVLILGIMLSSAISAIVSIMQYFSNETMLKAYVIWTMGSLGNLTSSQLTLMLLSVLAGSILSLISVKMLNALLLGEDYARSIGLDVRKSRYVIIAGTSILAGTITAFCGPIGFIGIAVPHLARIIFRASDHKILIPGTILTGAIIMLASDIISQMPGSDNVLPVNSVTALIGIPVVIWVILRDQKYREIF
ncbi:MAG TPA: iron ABC transporter [Bacteroidales bacterium]|jgi:iron complex transport system permease protein|nr:iron ABC transporter [Bacteroidales bacterium]HBZ19973.1 iron ABC transporter [Bacteroidales bacterium]